MPQRVVLDMRVWFLNVTAQLGQYAVFARYFRRCSRASSRTAASATTPRCRAELPAEQRVKQAFAAAQQRHDALPERERGLPPIEALRQLARLCSTVVSMTSIVQDLELIERLPSLGPYAKLLAGARGRAAPGGGQRYFQAGRVQIAREKYRLAIDRVEQPDHAGLDPVHYKAIRLGASYMQGVIGAARGQAAVHDGCATSSKSRGTASTPGACA